MDSGGVGDALHSLTFLSLGSVNLFAGKSLSPKTRPTSSSLPKISRYATAIPIASDHPVDNPFLEKIFLHSYDCIFTTLISLVFKK